MIDLYTEMCYNNHIEKQHSNHYKTQIIDTTFLIPQLIPHLK